MDRATRCLLECFFFLCLEKGFDFLSFALDIQFMSMFGQDSAQSIYLSTGLVVSGVVLGSKGSSFFEKSPFFVVDFFVPVGLLGLFFEE